MTEVEIRNALIARLASSPAGADAAFIAELFLDNFARRADLVMANGKLAVFEIKSSRDTLDRLDGQVSSYCNYFEQVTVVCAKRHLPNVIAMVPQGVGIWSVDRTGEMLVVRRAMGQQQKSKKNWLSFVPVDELRLFLRAQGLKATGTRADMLESVAKVSLRQVREFVLSYLKRRELRIAAIKEKRIRARSSRLVEKTEEKRLTEYLAQLAAPALKATPRRKE